jgi:hypothetical protein
MSTWIKAGFWQQLCNDCKGYKGWLNLTEFVKSIAQLYPGPMGPAGPMGSLTDAYYGSFYSLLDQQATVPNVTQAVIFEQTHLSNGVSITTDLDGYKTKITFQYPGVYNIAFSGQLHHRGGGGSGETIFMWFRQNGTDIPATNTKLTVPNGRFVIAAWNIFVIIATSGEYVQLVGYPDNTSITLEHIDATATQPAVPSMILTVNRIA